VSDHESDDERVAAFLDGRMDARRREEMLAHLTRSREDRAVLAGTAQILRQLEEAGAIAPGEASAPAAGQEAADTAMAEGVIPLDTRRPPRPGPRVLRWLALAAVLAGIALVTGRVLRPRSSIGDEPVRLAARLEHGAEGLPAGWTDDPPWTPARGDDLGGVLTPEERFARAAQAGAMLLDLSVAVEAHDAAATHRLATQIGRFDPRGGRSGGALRKIIDGAGGSPERLQPLVGEATERIAKRLDPDALRLGAWTEAARLAAAYQDTAFFRGGEAREMLNQAAAADPPARAAVQQVRPLLREEPLQWDALGAALYNLANELASE
jgi:hypothetical protein